MVNCYAAILILKIEENMQHFWCIMPYYFKKSKKQLKCKKYLPVYGEGAVIDRRCQSGLWSFLVQMTFWPNYSLLWGCPIHWKMFSNTPGLYPLEGNRGEIADILKISKSIKLLVKIKMCLFLYGKKTKQTFWPTQYHITSIEELLPK